MKGMELLKNDSQPGIWEISDKGRQYLKKKDYPKAREYWEKVLSINPEDKDAINALEKLKEKKV